MEIYSLPSDEYELCQPVEVMLKIYPDEVLALIPELELYGEGATEFEAVNDLKIEIIDLVRELEEISDEELGTDPKMWKKTLATLVKKCR